MQKFTRSLFALGALAGLVACGDDVSVTEPPKPTPAVTRITVSPPSLNLRVGQTGTLAATVEANDASVSRVVLWSSSAQNVASVSTAGVVTALAAGQTTITATAQADPNFKAAVQVTVGGSGITSILVSPASATLGPGDVLQAVANVTADAGVARTVTWSSSAPAVATVGATTGVITAVINGTAAIIARSTVDTTIFGAMALTVASTPATVSIKTITQNIGGLLAPVDLANTFGQIDVTLNVDPGTRQLCKVAVLIDNTEVASQTFGTSTNVQLSDSALMALVPTDVTLSVNTRAYNASTGVPSFFNGTHQLKAQLTTRTGTTCASAPDAQTTQTLTFRNVSGFIGTITTTGAASANDLAGFVWRTGALTIRALPVIFGDVNAPFTRPTIASAQINMGTPGCVASGTRSRAAVAAGTSFEAVFNNTDAAAAATNVVGYELNATGCPAPLQIGEVPTITAVGTDGNAVPVIVGGFLNSPNLVGNQFAEPNANFAVRLDNLAPVRPATPLAPIFGGFLHTNTTDTLRTNSWINAVLLLDDACPIGVATGNIDGTIPVPPGTLVRNCVLSRATDNGIGRMILGNTTDPLDYQIRVGDATLGTTAVDAQATVQTAAGLAESSSNSTYIMRARVADQLGNRSGSTSLTNGSLVTGFGVDNTAPRLGVDSATTTPLFTGPQGPLHPTKAVNTGPLSAVNIAFVAQDTASGGATPSGFFSLAGSPLTTSVRRVTLSGGAPQTRWLCPGAPTGTDPAPGFKSSIAAGGTCTDWFSGVNQNFRGPLTQAFGAPSQPAVGTTEAYYLTSSLVVDQAGNHSGAQSVEFLYDVTLPAVGGISSPAFLTGGTTATFTTAAQDNLDLASGTFTLAYVNTFAPFQFPSIALGTFGSDVFTSSANLALQYSFIRNMELAAPAPNGALANIPTNVTATATDVAGLTSPPSLFTIPAGSIQGPNFTYTSIVGFTSWTIVPLAAAVTVNRDAVAVTPNVNQVTLTAAAVGPTGTFQNPFTNRVEFWAQSAAAAPWRQIGTSTAPSVIDNGVNRTWSFTVTWNPSAADAPAAAAYNIIAVGVNTAGNALQTPFNAQVTIAIP